MNREARGSVGIAGLMLVGIASVEALLSGSPGLPHLGTAVMGIALLVVFVATNR